VLFIVVATGALLAMVCWRRALLALPGPQRAGLALSPPGPGNLIDRVIGRLVVDFIHSTSTRSGSSGPTSTSPTSA